MQSISTKSVLNKSPINTSGTSIVACAWLRYQREKARE
ncbi:Hypothetical protein ABZS17H1_00859 [Kosakonia cowanii]